MEMLKISEKGSYVLLELPYNGKAMPGQFFTIKAKTGPYIPRPFSVYELKDGNLKFLIKAGGEMQQFLNEDIIIDGPFGNPISKIDDVLLIAGGVGYAPIHFYALVYGFKEMIIGMPDDELFDFVDIPDHCVYVVNPTTPVDLAKLSPLKNILVCGPHEMIKGLKRDLPESTLYAIMEEKMACARGMCEGCAVMTRDGVKFVCKDGPTFKVSEVDLEWTYQ
ncbi:MAG: hypothetical protein M1542_08200 [Thermotogae bacterium]|jgi:dihydroorotate dehydrogenase electron transfer subunit|nr:hypothetical protein [Thermotogota bacterium]MCL5033208.1 hypothetical protein [Thermotogota bacterium]